MIKYLLLFKRLLKKKSYILMLAVVPAMVLLLNLVGSADAGIMTIGVCFEGNGQVTEAIKTDLENNPGSFRFITYDGEEQLENDVKNLTLNEGWIIPEAVDLDILNMKAKIFIREQGVSHLLAKEVLLSRIYPYYAKAFVTNYSKERGIDEDFAKRFDRINVNGDLFEMGYMDDFEVDESQEQTSYLLFPLRGILALHLMLCAITASMYFLEDKQNGLFTFWRCRLKFARELGYYLVIMIIPSIMMLIGLKLGGVFTSLSSELITLLVYVLLLIGLACIIRHVLTDTKKLGLSLPVTIFGSTIFAPVFIEFKEAGNLRLIFPTFHYLYSIHDIYFVYTMCVYAAITLVISCILAEFCRTSS